MTIGLLHPGEMGAAVGALLRASGQPVVWASSGRSEDTLARALAADLEDVGTLGELARRSEVIVSLCPPHAAVAVAAAVGAFDGIYLDANAVSPATARAIASRVGRYVDGSVVGPPPRMPGTTRLYLSGAEADAVAALFRGTLLETIVVSDRPDAASALKMVYAAWSKGTTALLLDVRALARGLGVEPPLLGEWETSRPELLDRSATAAVSAATKGWRWVGEMDEIADTFAAVGLPDGFHRAAAEVYRRGSGAAERDALEAVLERLLAAGDPGPARG